VRGWNLDVSGAGTIHDWSVKITYRHSHPDGVPYFDFSAHQLFVESLFPSIED
jgi:hypothetical protein